VFARARIRTDDREDSGSSAERAVRRNARLKDMLTTRGRLEAAVRRFGLYSEAVAGKSMLDAVEEMKPHVGFRAIEGGLYVISFDGHPADTVREVTAYLSDSLVEDYAAGDLDDLRREGDFLAREERASLDGLESSTRELTTFLAAHPEFAVEGRTGAVPFGSAPAQVPGATLAPRVVQDANASGDPELAALARQRARLDGQARAGAAARIGAPALSAARTLDEQIAQAEVVVEIAAKRVAETQADLASKSNLTEDHPDMRAARMAADAAARQLHEAKLAHADLQQAKPGGATVPGFASVPPDLAEKLRQVDAQIAQRRGQLARSRDASPRSPSPEVAAVVELETDWQRLLRSVGEARTRHDDLAVRAERTKLALAAARVKENEQMAVIEPAVRPTHPLRGGRTEVALAGLAMTVLLSIAYAAMRSAIDDRLFDADDVEALGLLPVLCVVPRLAPPRVGRADRGGRAAV
jgi:hypothetical protein